MTVSLPCTAHSAVYIGNVITVVLIGLPRSVLRVRTGQACFPLGECNLSLLSHQCSISAGHSVVCLGVYDLMVVLIGLLLFAR